MTCPATSTRWRWGLRLQPGLQSLSLSPTERLETKHHYCECKTRLEAGSREPCLWARLPHLWNSVSKWACHGTLLWASNKIVDIESLLGSTHLRDCSITRSGCFFSSVPFCRLGDQLVSGHSELGGHYLWVSAARHTIDHNEHVTAFSIWHGWHSTQLSSNEDSSISLLQGALVITSESYWAWERVGGFGEQVSAWLCCPPPIMRGWGKDEGVLTWMRSRLWTFPLLQWPSFSPSSQLCPVVSDSLCLVAQSCPALCNSMDRSLPGSSVHEDSSGKNTRVGCHALLQGTFPTQGLNPGLLHCRQILYHLSHPLPSEEIISLFSCPDAWHIWHSPEKLPTLYHHLYFQFSYSVVSNSLWPHGLQHTRPPCSSPIPGVYSNSCPLSWW